MLDMKTIIPSETISGEDILVLSAEKIAVNYGISPRTAVSRVNAELAKKFSPQSMQKLFIRRGIYKLFAPRREEVVRTKVGLYLAWNEERAIRRLPATKMEAAVLSVSGNLPTSQLVVDNLPKLGFRPANLDELICFAAHEPGITRFRGVVALGSQAIVQKMVHYPVYMFNPFAERNEIALVPYFKAHMAFSSIRGRINYSVYFLVVPL